MADNVAVTAGAGTSIATDDIAGVQYQRVKINIGADAVATDVAPPAADGVAATTLVPISHLIYNGTTFDRVRGATGDALAATGIQGVGNLVFNGTTWDRVRGDVANGLDVDVTRVTGTVTVDTELPAAAALADAAANPTTTSAGALNLLYNGATWDRVRGDTANGVDVDVTRVQGIVTVDSELPAAAALADATANPTSPLVGSANEVFNGTTWDRAKSVTAIGDANAATGVTATGGYLYNGTNFDRARTVVGITDANAGTGAAATGKYLFNGTTWDRERNNMEGTALVSTPRTATTASAEIVNYNGKGLFIVFAITVAPAAGNLTFQLRGRTSGGTTWVQYAGAAISTTGTFVYEIYPGIGSAADGVTGRSSSQVPRRFDINIVHSNANTTTYSVDYQLLV